MVNGSDNLAWELSGSPAPPPATTDPTELQARALLSARASAIIESHLPNLMLSQAAAQTDARALWSWLQGHTELQDPGLRRSIVCDTSGKRKSNFCST
ncbi:hypothetical protein AGABI1DRAFT_133740 [Agaricus bisporus var. burnettii JB137-S8]|uniref:Uncharacterized protein n=1 Tax=Agaricus bisporus var. burnettii (strain JB137-S8 / ATCC MYA-4627 / FGSC 10392) TaxID=597362 RepID=K5XHV6_AGABU|nr:uncharacterized protein AGABI1DRAFT_133740 [Agaricus bisporus var. burnettii JB137-S8]EKM74015.1 hypothetical protein AGABI1DRAFT_133740 [Agaricus bisporus var. burnettii JB137-S8]